MHKLKRSLRSITMLGLAAAFALGVSGNARADVSNGCLITTIGLDDLGSGLQLKLECGGVWHYTNTQGGCPSTSNELVKMWESMAMSAMLAGKRVNIHYSPPAGSCPDKIIRNVDVLK